MAGYQKNTWVIYDRDIPAHKQPDAFITKAKLDNIEVGIENAITGFSIGTVTKGANAYCEIIPDENNPSVKRINMVIPKEVSWLFSETELQDQSVAPTGAFVNDMILDSKGNIFTIYENINGVYILNKRLNIKGADGIKGDIGPEGKSGADGKDGLDGNKWVHINKNLYDGEEAPENANVGDFILDDKYDVFEVLDNLRLSKLFNIRGEKGDAYYLEIGNVTSGEIPSAEISNNKLNLVLPMSKSTYDIWKELGNTGNASEFIESLRGEQGPSIKILNSLDEVLSNEEEGVAVGALAIKELYLKIQELIQVK